MQKKATFYNLYFSQSTGKKDFLNWATMKTDVWGVFWGEGGSPD